MKYNSEERTGIYSVAKIFTENLKWIFREQPTNDFGIDAFVEITMLSLNLKEYVPFGKLIGIQIKSGKSYFKEAKEEHFVFRGSKKHLTYWLNYCMPVILIIYDKEMNVAYWQEVNSSTVIITQNSFKINVPKRNVLKNENRQTLANIAYFQSNSQYKLWQLQNSTDEIKLLINDQLFMHIEIDSIPKTHCYYVTLILSNEDSEDPIEIFYGYDNEAANRSEYRFFLLADMSLTEAINDTIPWADLYIEGAVFADQTLTGIIADEILQHDYDQNDIIQDICELRKKNSTLQLACYLTGSYLFKAQLRPNQLSYAFLNIDYFLKKEPIVKTRIFI